MSIAAGAATFGVIGIIESVIAPPNNDLRPNKAALQSRIMSFRSADQDGGGTVIFHAGCAKTPYNIVVALGPISLGFAIRIIADTLSAIPDAATITISDQIGLAVRRIEARPYP